MIEEESMIIAEIKAGHTEKFGLLYDEYFKKIYNYFFYRLHNKQVTEDLVSTTFLKAIKHFDSFNHKKGDFSVWLYRIARNTLFDYYRTAKNTEKLVENKIIISPEDFQKEVFNKELAGQVENFLNHLTEKQREVILMRIWDGLSYSEISEVIGKSEAGSKMIFYRAIEKLKSVAGPFYAAK